MNKTIIIIFVVLGIIFIWNKTTNTQMQLNAAKHSQKILEEKQISKEFNRLIKKGFYEKAISLYQKSCDNGYGKVCSNLGTHYYTGLLPVRKDRSKGLRLLEKGCDYKDMQGCYILAGLYTYDKNVKHDYKKALKLSKKACEGGHAAGCFLCGSAYEVGRGTNKNREKAKKYFSLACEKGASEGCGALKNYN